MTLQWNHPVVHQPDFLPSWMASARALDLHLELHPFDFNVPVCLDKALGLPAPRYRSHKKLQVCFADSFEFFSGLESTPTWSRCILPLEVHGQTTSWSTVVDEPETSADPLHGVEPPRPLDLPLHAKHVQHGLWCGIRDDPARCEEFCPLNPVSPSFDGHVQRNFETPPADSIDEVPAAAPEADEDPQQEGQPRRLRDGPDQHQPVWMQPLWNLLQESGHIEMLEEGLVAYLNSHYVSHQRHRRNDSPRPVRIDMDYETWEEGFRFVWEDLADPEAAMEVYVVAPSPPLTMFQGTVGTVILVQHPLPDHIACVITCVLGAPPEARITETAHSFEPLMEYDTVIRASDMAEVCRMGETYHLCDLKIGRLTLPPGQAVQLQNGLGLQLQLLNSDDDIPIEIVDEDQSLMQTFASSSSGSPSPSTEAPTRYMSRVFKFDGSFCDGALSWDTSERFWDALGNMLHLPRSNIRAVYPVRDPPADLQVNFQRVFIVHSFCDRRPADQMRVVLLDVHYENSDLLERSIKWVPFKLTSDSLLKLLRLEALCWWVTDECTIWQNDHLVPVNQLDPIDVFHGDYLKVRITLNLEPHECEDDPPQIADQVTLLQAGIQNSWKIIAPYEVLPVCFNTRRIGDDPPLDGPRTLLDLGERADRDRVESARQAALMALPSTHRPTTIAFQSWFLSGLTFPRCSTSRTLWLGPEPQDWYDEVQRVWGHRLDPHSRYRLLPVDPPAEPSDGGGHLLIVQHEHHHERAVLLTNFWHGDNSELVVREAHMLPSWLFFDHLLAYLGLREDCRERRYLCLGFVGSEPIDAGLPMYPRTGSSIEIHTCRMGTDRRGLAVSADWRCTAQTWT